MTSEAPNPWSKLHEDAKSYITLATALLGVTATFANNLLSDDTLGRWAVIIGWVMLVASIASSIYANGKVFAGLKISSSGTNYNRASGWLNAAVTLLLVGTVALAAGAWRTSLTDTEKPTQDSPATLARQAVAEMTGTSELDLVVDNLEKHVGNDFTLLVRNKLGSNRFEVTVDGDRAEVTQVRVVP